MSQLDAVILAAGVGSRLKALTGEKPKCLVRVNGRAMIDWQIDALLEAGVGRVLVVAGFAKEALVRHLESRGGPSGKIIVIENNDFATTNNMYSLSLCRSFVAGKPFLLMNADVVFESGIVRDLLTFGGCAICVDVGAYNPESMKVVRDPVSGLLTHISKQISPVDAYGSSIDIYRFDEDGSNRLFEHVVDIVDRQGKRNDWTEVALDQLMRAGRLGMQSMSIEGRPWYEIDNLDDLAAAEALFGRRMLDWDQLRVAFVDMDGTLYRGKDDLPGVARFIAELRQRLEAVYFLSNNSSKSHAQYVERLRRLGVEATPADVVLSSDALGSALARRGIQSVYVLGTAALTDVLASYGVMHTPHEGSAQAVVVGYDTELTYAKLCDAAYCLQREDVRLFATHTDIVCPTERGSIPDIGALLALIERATGRVPEASFGKPDANMVHHLLERHGVTGQQAVFFGDRVYTDYEMARRCDAQFVGVLTGEATRADFEGLENIVVFPSVAAVFDTSATSSSDDAVQPLALGQHPVAR